MICDVEARKALTWDHELGLFVDTDGQPVYGDQVEIRYKQLQLAYAALKEQHEVEREKWQQAAREAAAGGSAGPGGGVWDLLRRLRSAQKEYFATRDKAALSESKRLERELDRIIQAKRAGEKAGQMTLADGGA